MKTPDETLQDAKKSVFFGSGQRRTKIKTKKFEPDLSVGNAILLNHLIDRVRFDLKKLGQFGNP